MRQEHWKVILAWKPQIFLARKINFIYISCSFLSIVLSWRAVGKVEPSGSDLAKPSDVMNDFSHPGAWHRERSQRVVLLFLDVKRPITCSSLAFIMQRELSGAGPIRQTCELVLFKSVANVHRKNGFQPEPANHVLANSLVNMLPEVFETYSAG